MTISNSDFKAAIDHMRDFIYEMNPDIDMCYDCICGFLGIDTFVANKEQWDMFYDAWDSLQQLDA